jgi:N-acylneuraminate cytidylyltransferase
MTVSRNHQKLGKIIENNFVPFNYRIGQRSQDLEPLYYENGLLYIMDSKLLLQEKIVGGANSHFWLTIRSRVSTSIPNRIWTSPPASIK